MRDLDQQSGAVSGIGVRADGPAVLEVAQDLEPFLDYVVRAPVLHVDDEADPAGVVLETGIVKAPERGTS